MLASPLWPVRGLYNPYLTFFEGLPPTYHRDPSQPAGPWEQSIPGWLTFKASVAMTYAWAVPTADAIATIGRNAPRIVEIGSGSGYWAWLLSQLGVDVLAFDVAPPAFLWHPVYAADATVARHFPDRALLLCWPPWGSPMARDALCSYAGSTVIFIGEWMGGTADPEFFAHLATKFQVIDSARLPQWFARDDHLWVFRRV